MEVLRSLDWECLLKRDHVYEKVFQNLKPWFIERLETIITQNKSVRGRKRTTDLGLIWECLWGLLDNGFKMRFVQTAYRVAKSTMYYYFGIIRNSGLLPEIYQAIVQSYYQDRKPQYLITDTFTVKSMDGSEGTGRNPTDRGRKGIKVSLICDENRIVMATHISPANTHDTKVLVPTCRDTFIPVTPDVEMLADAGYAGKNYIKQTNQVARINLVVKQKKTRYGGLSHTITSAQQATLLHRNRIELLNGQIRRFRGIMIKYTKSVASYYTLLMLAIIVVSCYQIVTLTALQPQHK
jgi:hypothetical protein